MRKNKGGYEIKMPKNKKKLRVGTNFAIFILFFGLALIKSIKNNSWIEASIFFILGLLFLRFGD